MPVKKKKGLPRRRSPIFTIAITTGIVVFIGITLWLTSRSLPGALMSLEEAMRLPTTYEDCHDVVPQGQRDFKNETLGVSLHWTGCVTYVSGKYGAAHYESQPDGNIIITRVFIPVDVTTAQQQAIWNKEVIGNAYAILFGPGLGAKFTDGLAGVALHPNDQHALGLQYPYQNKIFGGQYIQWQPVDAKTAQIDCRVILAVHYTSLQGSLGSVNNQGILELMQSGQPFAPCMQFLQNP